MNSMNKNIYRYLLLLVSFLFITTACKEDDRDTDYLNGLAAPSNIALQVVVSQDNTGTVSLIPSGDNASAFTIDFGDGTEETVDLLPGESAVHIYGEGSYNALVIARNINGDTAEFTQQVVVSFRPPENLEITVSPVNGDNFSINVSAEADFATGFEVYFGENPNESPTPLMVGERITYTYSEVGTYELRVVALSGGAGTIEGTVTVVIENPVTLPLDFESDTIEYVFDSFGGGEAQIIDNPDPSGINTSGKVVEFFKEEGAEIFAGTAITLGAPIDFSEFQSIKIASWSPQAGLTVKMKLENGTDPNVSVEIDAQTTVVNQWEEIIFDFSEEDLSQDYSKIVVFYDFGNPGTGTTFYFDNIEQTNDGGGGGGPFVELPVDFENDDLDYVIIGFEGADSAREANPDPSGINTSANVVRTTKTEGAQFFAGTIVELDVQIDFSETEMIAVKTWSPKAGIPVRLKLEDASGSQFVELDVNTTVSDQWEELVWDFSGMTAGSNFTKVVIFFEFIVDLPGDGSTYYFDDIRLAN